MRIERRYTKDGQSPYADIEFRLTTSEIRNPDGSVVFHADNVEVPAFWSQVAVRRAGAEVFPQGRRARAPEEGRGGDRPVLAVALGRRRGRARGPAREGALGRRALRPSRCSTGWPAPGPTGAGRAATSTREADARAFFDELCYMLAMQMAAPNSPQWFNTGLHWAYGIDGPSQGHYYVDFADRQARPSRSRPTSTRSRTPASSSRSTTTSSTRAGSWTCGCARRACSSTAPAPAPTSRALRGEGERLSGGGKSSGLMSFLKIGDRAAGAIKSGGTTRRAAKMVIVDTDHPDIEQFIDWKVIEEQKVAALVTGSKINQKHLRADPEGLRQLRRLGRRLLRAREEPGAAREIKRARARTTCRTTTSSASSSSPSRATPTSTSRSTTPTGICEAYLTVSGQNSNNSVRVTDEFLKAVEADGDWDLTWRTKPGKIAKTVKARDLWEKIGHAAWACADPGPAVPHHDQRLAHLPGVGPDPRLEPVLGIHVPRRHGLQSRVAEPARVPRRRRRARSTSRATSTPSGCGPSCSKSRC